MLPDLLDLWKAIYFSIGRDNTSGNLHLYPKHRGQSASYRYKLQTRGKPKVQSNEVLLGGKFSIYFQFCCPFLSLSDHIYPILAQKWLGPGMAAPCDGFWYSCCHCGPVAAFCSRKAEEIAMFLCSSSGQVIWNHPGHTSTSTSPMAQATALLSASHPINEEDKTFCFHAN